MTFRKAPLDRVVELQMEAQAHLSAAYACIKRANQIIDPLAMREQTKETA